MDWPIFFTPTVEIVTLLLVSVLVPAVRGIYHELRMLNGSMIALKVRLEGHMELDEIRLADLKEILRKEEGQR